MYYAILLWFGIFAAAVICTVEARDDRRDTLDLILLAFACLAITAGIAGLVN